MNIRQLTPLLPLAVLALVLTACSDDSDGNSGKDDTTESSASGPLAEDASLAWSAQLDQDWSPTHAVAVADRVILSTSWEIDEGAYVTAYDDEGSRVWSESVYGGALLAPVGDDEVLICTFEYSSLVSAEDGEEFGEQGPADDERCPVADDEAGIPVPHNDEAYTVNGNVVTVDGPDGSYEVVLAESVGLDGQPVTPEIWGVEGGIVAFVDETDTVLFYR
jgi:hypothetical protein